MSKEIIKDPNQVLVFDSSLRDGDQATRPPGFRPEEYTLQNRLEIADMLNRLGVDIIEAGFPSSSQASFEAVSEIAKTIHGPTIAALSGAVLPAIERSWRAIEPAKDYGGARLHIVLGTSPTHMRDKLKMTPDEVVYRIGQSVRKAREFTNDVEFSPEDASRSDFKFMMRAILTAVDAGATTINIPDTVGFSVGSEYSHRLAKAKRMIDNFVGKDSVTVSAHCHDDLGMATANTLAAVHAGIRQVEGTILGIGERAGNTALEEVVTAIRVRPDYFKANGRPLFTGINPNYLMEAAELVARLSGFSVPYNKAIVGGNCFRTKSGQHLDGLVRNPNTYYFMDPKATGQRSSIVISELSGKAGAAYKAEQLGFDMSDVGFSKELIIRAKDYSTKNEVAVTDVELERMAADIKGETLTADRFVLEKAETHEADHKSKSRLTIFIDGKPHEGKGEGNGPINAAVHAVNDATGYNLDLISYAERALGEGSDARAGCWIAVGVKDGEITSYAEDVSTHLAAVKAYVAGLNTIDRSERRKENRGKQS